jgi:hypothetical protein
MRVYIKGSKIILSQASVRYITRGLIIESPKFDSDFFIIDVVKGQKEYELPEGVVGNDVTAAYIRVL